MIPPETPDFFLDEQRMSDGRVVLAVRGSIDLFAAPELKRRLLAAVNRGATDIVLDFSATEFLDSTGLGALLTAYKRLSARGGRLLVVPGDATVARVFEITGLDTIFTFAATREEALALAQASA